MRACLCTAAFLVAGCDKLLGLSPVELRTSYRKPITITQSTAATLTDVPVSIVVAADPDLIAHARADGSDLAFGDDLGPLDYEVVEYAAGTLEAWVRVPTLPAGQTTIYLDYGAAAPTHDPTKTWADAYVGVWHMAGTGPIVRDASHHGHDLTAQSSPTATVTGVVGHARAFDAAMDQRVCGGDADMSLELDGATSFTFEVWLYVDQMFGTIDIPLHKGGSDPQTPGFDIELATGVWRADLADGTNIDNFNTIDAPTPLHRWVELTYVVDRSVPQLRAYVDGQLAAMRMPMTTGSLADTTQPMCLGAEDGGSQPFNGMLDEVRVLRGAASAELIQFAHANELTPSATVALGAEQPVF